jgi:hypothetical protein
MSDNVSYLEKNLLPAILNIKTPKTKSYIMIAAGLGDNTSQSSVLIQVGIILENFWNKVISDVKGCDNLIELNNMIEVNGKNRQLDHVFRVIDEIFYTESKCYLDFDSEKKPASNDKVMAICEVLSKKYDSEIHAGYFVPCIRNVPENAQKKYPNIKIYGVEWLMNKIKCDLFTVDEFFIFFEEVIGPILENKIYS